MRFTEWSGQIKISSKQYSYVKKTTKKPVNKKAKLDSSSSVGVEKKLNVPKSKGPKSSHQIISIHLIGV